MAEPMAERRVSTGALAEMIELYRKLLAEASKIEVDLGDGTREELEEGKKKAILEALDKASATLALGCQQTVYGLFLTS